VKPTILLIDDNIKILESLADLLVPLGFKTLSATNTREAVSRLAEDRIDVVLLDVRLGDENGIDCFRELRRVDDQLPVIIITGYATVDNAVEAMKLGAFDYFKKPLDFERLIKVIENAAKLRTLASENRQLKAHISRNSVRYTSGKMRELLDKASLLAETELPILVLGENGTGKEMIADLVHDRSRRSGKEFHKINCAAFPESLLDNELFGHDKGSYTGAVSDFKGVFERANGGTLFLDEIGDMPLTIQAKILRVLQNNEIRRIGGRETLSVNVRFIAATNKDLSGLIRNGLFREDLYYRLNAATISVPPLRERKEDLLLLCDYFLDEFELENGPPRKALSPEVVSLFTSYRWPGNVRELRNTIMYIAAVCRDRIITPKVLPPIFSATRDAGRIDKPESSRLQDLERQAIAEAFRETGGNKKQTAERLGMSRNTLYRKLREYGIETDGTN